MNPTTAAIRRLKALCLGYHVLVGMVGIGIVPALVTSFETSFHLSHAQIGVVTGTAVIGAGVGSFLGGFLFDRFGPRLTLTGATALFAVSALAVWRAPTPALLTAALFVFQASHGLGSTVNALFGRLHAPPERTRALNLLHGFLGIGFLLAPLVVALSLRYFADWRPVFLLAAVLFALCALAFYRLLARAATDESPAPPPDGLRAASRYLLDGRLMLALVGFVFITGCEIILMTWVPPFAEFERGFAKTAALLALSAIMAGYTAVRLWLGLRPRGATPRFIAASVALNLIGVLLISNARHALVLYVGSGVAGLSIGALWPSLAAAIFAYIRGGHGVVGGMFNTLSVVGISGMVSLSGRLADIYTLRPVLWLAPVCALVFAALYTAFHRLARRAGRPIVF